MFILKVRREGKHVVKRIVLEVQQFCHHSRIGRVARFVLVGNW